MLNEHSSAAQWRSHVFRLALPVMISNSTVPLVGIVDTAVMGRMGAAEYVAATAVGAVIFSSIFWVFGFLRMATGGLVAQAYGAQDQHQTGQLSVRALLLGLALGLLVWLLQIPLLQLALMAMQDDAPWQPLTQTYFQIRIYSAPATLMIYALIGSLVGLQRMREVLYLNLLLNVLNMALNIALFTYTELGIAGVAMATVFSEYVTLALGIYLLRHQLSDSIRQQPLLSWLLERQAITRYFRISGDLFIRTLCLTFIYYWMTVVSAKQGVLILAANTVLLHMVSFMAHCMDGYAHAVESLTGYSIGNKNYRMLNKAIRASVYLGLASALVFSAVYWLAGDTIIALMVTDEAVRSTASAWLPWVVLAPLTGLWSFLLDGMFIGATLTASMRNSMVISLILFMVLISLLVPLWGNSGLWLSYFAVLIARAATLAAAWPKAYRNPDGATG